jgi:hypothetical protein
MSKTLDNLTTARNDVTIQTLISIFEGRPEMKDMVEALKGRKSTAIPLMIELIPETEHKENLIEIVRHELGIKIDTDIKCEAALRTMMENEKITSEHKEIFKEAIQFLEDYDQEREMDIDTLLVQDLKLVAMEVRELSYIIIDCIEYFDKCIELLKASYENETR